MVKAENVGKMNKTAKMVEELVDQLAHMAALLHVQEDDWRFQATGP